jgi:hypothetical protein
MVQRVSTRVHHVGRNDIKHRPWANVTHQTAEKVVTTFSPCFNHWTSLPTCSIVPMNSWPYQRTKTNVHCQSHAEPTMICPDSVFWWPRYMCNSLPHSPATVTFTTASVGSTICGRGRSSTSILHGPLKTTAFMLAAILRIL